MDDQKKPFIYCNQIGFATSPWDILWILQRVAASRGDKPAVTQATTQDIPAHVGLSVEEELHVAMSPSHAKVAVAMLYGMIESYEKNSGRIPLDKDHQAKYDEFIRKVKALS